MKLRHKGWKRYIGGRVHPGVYKLAGDLDSWYYEGKFLLNWILKLLGKEPEVAVITVQIRWETEPCFPYGENGYLKFLEKAAILLIEELGKSIHEKHCLGEIYNFYVYFYLSSKTFEFEESGIVIPESLCKSLSDLLQNTKIAKLNINTI